jgi:hypothetical protein
VDTPKNGETFGVPRRHPPTGDGLAGGYDIDTAAELVNADVPALIE